MTGSLDFDADDFAREPWRYPGTLPSTSGLVQGRSYRVLTPKPARRLGQACVRSEGEDTVESLNEALLFANAARVDFRHIVVAVGSNAAPAVMRRKFLKHDVDTTAPFLRAELRGIRVAHSAHVSTPGYIAATPVVEERATTSVVVSLLDDEQLACLDSTEPNYTRKTLSCDSFGLSLEGGEQPAQFHVYASKWGVLAPPGDQALPFMSQQEELFAELMRYEPFGQEFARSDFHDNIKRLGNDEEVRTHIRELFKTAGWARTSGLDEVATLQPKRYGAVPSRWPDAEAAEGAICLPTPNDMDREGEQCVVVHPDVAAQLGGPAHVGIQAVQAPTLPLAPARLVTDVDVDRRCILVDQVLRNAMGVELQERVAIQPISVRTTPVADRLLSRTHFAMVRVQAADLASVEQQIALLSPLTMDVLGMQDGDRAVLQGAPGEDGRVADVRLPVHRAPEDVVARRERLSGGSLSARFPSASDALGTYPDLPWIFLDSAARSHLGVDSCKLAIVRIRASRRFQLTREFRELLLLMAIAFLGLATLVDSSLEVMGFLLAIAAISGLVVRARLRHRLEAGLKTSAGPK